MANKKISELNIILQTALVDTDLIVIARPGGETFKMTVGELDSRYNQSPVRYFGDPNIDGSWRERVSGGVLYTEKRVSGNWVIKREVE